MEYRARRRWPWYTVAAVLGLLGGALGYLWLHPEAKVPRIAAKAPVSPASPALPAALSLQPIVEGTPAPPVPDIAGIHSLLDRWSSALKRGDVQTAAECYAPVVSTFFSRHDVPREVVRQSLRLSQARYGRLDVYRLAGLGITPVSDNQAVATFRKRWQTAGRRKVSGEEVERMTLVRNQGVWQISSEQAEAR